MSLLQLLRYSSLTDRLGKASRWDPAKVERVRQKRLRQLIRYAVEKSPYFRHKYRAVDLNGFDLSQLPTCRKEELAEHFDEAVTDRAVCRHDVEQFVADPANLGKWYLGKYSVSHTSGSQGSPSLIVQDRSYLELLFAMMSARANASRPGLIEGIRRLISPARVAIVTMRRGFYPSAAAYEFMPEFVGRYANILRLSSMQEDLVDQLNAFQPNVLVAYASVLEALALQIGRLKLDSLLQIANSSEQLTERALARIREAFRVPVLNHYGMGECTILSMGCRTDAGSHVNTDWTFLEVVDENYCPVPDGQLGAKVLVTNLANRVQPIIRFEVDDRLALADRPCGCGNRLPRIERIEGRGADIFWTHDGRQYRFITVALFHTVVDDYQEIREWQAVHLERNRIELRVQLMPGATVSAETMRRTLLDRFARSEKPSHVSLDVKIVSSLMVDPRTGKFRRMINQVERPDDLGQSLTKAA